MDKPGDISRREFEKRTLVATATAVAPAPASTTLQAAQQIATGNLTNAINWGFWAKTYFGQSAQHNPPAGKLQDAHALLNWVSGQQSDILQSQLQDSVRYEWRTQHYNHRFGFGGTISELAGAVSNSNYSSKPGEWIKLAIIQNLRGTMIRDACYRQVVDEIGRPGSVMAAFRRRYVETIEHHYLSGDGTFSRLRDELKVDIGKYLETQAGTDVYQGDGKPPLVDYIFNFVVDPGPFSSMWYTRARMETAINNLELLVRYHCLHNGKAAEAEAISREVCNDFKDTYTNTVETINRQMAAEKTSKPANMEERLKRRLELVDQLENQLLQSLGMPLHNPEAGEKQKGKFTHRYDASNLLSPDTTPPVRR